MPNEVLITDLVAQEALDQLEQLDRKMERTLGQFHNCAMELAKGLKIPVEVTGDLDKLQQLTNTTMQRASQAAQQYTQQLQQQQQVIANTTNTISRQLAEQEKLNKSQREAFTQQQQALDIADRILGSHEQNVRTLARYSEQLKQLKAEMKAGAITTEEYTRRELELKTAKQEVQKILNNETKMNHAAAGSYSQLSLQLERLKQAQKQLNEEEKAGAEGKTLEKEIQSLDAHLKDLAADMGEYQRNVGNYAIAGESMRSSLRGLTETITQLTMQYESLSAEEKNGVFGQELKSNITALTEQASKYKDAISDVKESIAKGASDTRMFDSLAESGKVLISTLGMCSSAAKALGLSNDSLQQSMLKVQVAMQAVQALTVLQNATQKQSNLMKGIAILQSKAAAAALRIEAAATQQATGATVAQTAAQKALNAVAKANPYVLLATAILAVVAAVIAWSSKTNEAKKRTEDLSVAVKEQSSEYANNRAELSRLQNEWDKLTSKKEREEWVKRNRDAFHSLGIEVTDARQAENVLVKNTSAFVKAMSLRAQAAAYAAQATKEYQAAIENRTDAENSRSGLSFFQKAWAVINYDTRYDESVDQAIDRYAKDKAGELYAKARQAEDRADSYIKKQAELEEQADAMIQKAGITKYTGGGTTSKTGGGTRGGSGSTTEVKAAQENDLELIRDYHQRELEEIRRHWQQKIDAITGQSEKEKELRLKLQEAMDLALAEAENNYQQQRARINLENAIAAAEDGSIQEYALKIRQLDQQREAEIEAAEKTGADVETIRDKYRKMEDKLEQEFASKMVEHIANRVTGEQVIADANYQNKVAELNKEYVAAVNNAQKTGESLERIEEQYLQRKVMLDNEYANDTLQRQINAIEEELDVEGLSEKEREQLQRELTTITAQLANQRSEQEKNAIEEVVKADEEAQKKRQQNIQEWLERTGEVVQKIGEFISTMYDSQISKIEELIEAEQLRYEQEVEHIEYLAENEAITAEEAEYRKREAEAATAKKQEELEKKKATAEYKKAVMEKANSISQIAIATALGIMKASPNIPLMAFVGAMGAIQAATALAQPIKAYAEGTKGKPHPGGLALVGDGGSQELVMYNGKAWVTPDKPTLLDLPKGAEVIPDLTPKDLLTLGASLPMSVPRDRATGQPVIINDYSSLETRMVANTKAVTKALRVHQDAITRQLKRQEFNAYIARRT